MKAIAMIVTSVVVAAALAGLLFWFTRRLNRIEDARWGELRRRGHWG